MLRLQVSLLSSNACSAHTDKMECTRTDFISPGMPTRLGPRQSLELQKMTDLRAAVKRVNKEDGASETRGPRDIVTSEQRYNNRVLQENWFEERSEYHQSPLPPRQHFRSHYMADFRRPCPPGLRDMEGFYEQKFRDEGVSHEVLFQYGGDAYENNLSTTYDLCYNHMAKCDPHAKPKTYSRRLKILIPQQDLAENHGNVTNYGLREYKTQEWTCEKENAYLKLSEMKDKYRPMKEDDLQLLRIAVPKAFSSSIYDPNTKNKDITLRGARVNVVTNGIVTPQKPSLKCCLQAYERTMAARRLRR